VGGKMAMTTGGKVPLLGGEINLTKDINDYTFKVRRTFGDYDLSKGLTGNMVGASLGKDLGNAYVTAGLDIPKGVNGLPSLKQTQAFLKGGGDLGSLSVIIGRDLLQTGYGVDFQVNAIELAKKLGLIKPKPQQKVDDEAAEDVTPAPEKSSATTSKTGPDKTNWPEKLSLPRGGGTVVNETFKRWKKLIK